MIMLNDFTKNLTKWTDGFRNAIVVGSRWGYLKEISETFNTVFLFSFENQNFKEKNVVYRESFANVGELTEVSAVFLELELIDKLRLIKPVWTRDKSLVIIQGSTVVNPVKADDLIKNNYYMAAQHDLYHIWKLKE